MANLVCNIAKGRINELYKRVKNNDPANSAFIIVLLKVAEVDATLIDYDDLGTLIAGANTEADFTNYARKVITDVELAAIPAPDDSGDTLGVDLPDQIYTSAGGATNNTMVKALICYDSDTTAGTDTNIEVLTIHDYTPTTTGVDLPLNIDPLGWFSAA